MRFSDLKIGDWFTIKNMNNDIYFIKAFNGKGYCVLSPLHSSSIKRGKKYDIARTAEVNLVMKLDFKLEQTDIYQVENTITPEDDKFKIGDYVCLNDNRILLKISENGSYLSVWDSQDKYCGLLLRENFKEWQDMHGSIFHIRYLIREEKEFI